MVLHCEQPWAHLITHEANITCFTERGITLTGFGNDSPCPGRVIVTKSTRGSVTRWIISVSRDTLDTLKLNCFESIAMLDNSVLVKCLPTEFNFNSITEWLWWSNFNLVNYDDIWEKLFASKRFCLEIMLVYTKRNFSPKVKLAFNLQSILVWWLNFNAIFGFNFRCIVSQVR